MGRYARNSDGDWVPIGGGGPSGLNGSAAGGHASVPGAAADHGGTPQGVPDGARQNGYVTSGWPYENAYGDARPGTGRLMDDRMRRQLERMARRRRREPLPAADAAPRPEKGADAAEAFDAEFGTEDLITVDDEAGPGEPYMSVPDGFVDDAPADEQHGGPDLSSLLPTPDEVFGDRPLGGVGAHGASAPRQYDQMTLFPVPDLGDLDEVPDNVIPEPDSSHGPVQDAPDLAYVSQDMPEPTDDGSTDDAGGTPDTQGADGGMFHGWSIDELSWDEGVGDVDAAVPDELPVPEPPGPDMSDDGAAERDPAEPADVPPSDDANAYAESVMSDEGDLLDEFLDDETDAGAAYPQVDDLSVDSLDEDDGLGSFDFGADDPAPHVMMNRLGDSTIAWDGSMGDGAPVDAGLGGIFQGALGDDTDGYAPEAVAWDEQSHRSGMPAAAAEAEPPGSESKRETRSRRKAERRAEREAEKQRKRELRHMRKTRNVSADGAEGKGGRWRVRIGRLLILIGIVMIAVAAYFVLPPLLDRGHYSELASSVISTSGKDSQPDDSGSQPKDESASAIDWETLRQTNGDVRAWVQVPSADIDLPVVQGADNDAYLHRSFWGEESQGGCPFLDYRASADGYNALSYGHHMSGIGGMYSGLYDRWEQGSFDELGPLAWATPSGTVMAKPLAALHVLEDYAPIQTFGFKPDDAEVKSELEEMNREAEQVESGKDADGNAITRDDAVKRGWNVDRFDTEKPTDEIRQAAERRVSDAKYHEWLNGILADSTARAVDAQRLADDSSRVVTLVCCSSMQVGQPWRCCVVFAVE